MVAKWREGYDVVLAARKDRSSDSWAKRSTASAFYRVMGRLSSVDIPSNVGDFRLMDRRAVEVLCQYRELQRFMKGLFASLGRSEEHTSELQSLMRISYAVFCLKKKKDNIIRIPNKTATE